MNENKKNIIIISVLIVILIVIVLIVSKKLNQKEKPDIERENYEVQNEVRTDNTASTEQIENDEEIKKLKEEYKITGNSVLYRVETESDGRKVINIKSSINYKVAFAGMIKNSRPDFNEIDSIFKENYPTQNGIWIKLEDREKIEKYLNKNELLQSEYKINEKGYLEIVQDNNVTNIDNKIHNLINSNKQYIFCISSICYMVEPVSGEIVDNPYNEFEKYQTYEYFEDENKMIIFITENKDDEMTNKEIFQSIVDLIDLQK